MGTFGYIAKQLYFVSMSHVFGSNTLADLWETLLQAIQKMITVISTRSNLVQKHMELIDMLKWQKRATVRFDLIQAFVCNINSGVVKEEQGICTQLSAKIYIDDILAAAACKEIMERLLTAITKAIFSVCGQPDIAVCQCPRLLLLEKWNELIVGPRQIILGLIVVTAKMTVSISHEHIQQLRDLLNL